MRFAVVLLATVLLPCSGSTASPDLAPTFTTDISPILDNYCYDCHGFGLSKGGLTLDELDSEAALNNPNLWLKVLKKTRAGLMPPVDEAQPATAEVEALAQWIKTQVFKSDPANPDPGKVTLRRLNQAEYRNTIRDLTGVNYDTALEFPPDDTGEGFDNIGEVLNISPMLLEKYFDAAQDIIADAIARQGLAGLSPPELKRALPADSAGRQIHARTLLENFATKAFRRPVNESTLDRLVHLAGEFSSSPGRMDETGIAQALVAILASPRFIFRDELPAPSVPGESFPLIDEYSLATRLSYFFWSTSPDAELTALARDGRLRENLDAQVARMLASPQSGQFVENFVGQWLHSRDIRTATINDFQIFLREHAPSEVVAARKTLSDLEAVSIHNRTPEQIRLGDEAVKILTTAFARLPRVRFSNALRGSMQQETEMHFAYILREDRSVLELLDADYAFLDERLANHYGIPGVVGTEMRKVTLPADSPRGGILTQGTILATTSNPTRTSPVKRGVFILDNILGAPPAPPPPNITSLEDAASPEEIARMTLRDTLALHRAQPLCSSCHDSMDPLGLALENFNAMGQWRDQEQNEPIDASGRLITGETFQTISELKRILVTRYRQEFYYCVSEKLLIYALGRSLQYYDTPTLDRLVHRLEETGGSLASLVNEVVQTAPFQRMRVSSPVQTALAHPGINPINPNFPTP